MQKFKKSTTTAQIGTKDNQIGDDYKEELEEDSRYWRAIEKIIVHSGFKTEALSWKGFDYALVKLSKKV